MKVLCLILGARAFELVPKQFEGSFENFPVERILAENSDDDLFHAFEERYRNATTTPSTTENELEEVMKIKMVKNFIMYLQDVPRFGKYFNYGCHCFKDNGKDYLKNPTFGKPRDRSDQVCQDHQKCHHCIKLDYGHQCKATKGYKFEARMDSLTGVKYIQCEDKEGSCEKNLCECDKALAYDLADTQGIWSLANHVEWGAFKGDQSCEKWTPPKVQLKSARLMAQLNPAKHECCGEYPRRFPYVADNGEGVEKKCCAGSVFSPDSHECCDEEVKEIGMCVGTYFPGL
ncbi:Oidioi.mRNA.OKI2018_I69.chr1.g719.t1.cds [Oikopleura dioica]|uniref:Oidioi.mRNA.OKI2018_I69.chr1.g719.t1.cds n=1 Tax=Oikopleura dioica TaxID=34765 RepID=A0ABN7SSW6_OIKDI|nr:Oidioi.mRNA.OKI2018_I69.chr1.g719.t1.cds [Oikopleura dioica]